MNSLYAMKRWRFHYGIRLIVIPFGSFHRDLKIVREHRTKCRKRHGENVKMGARLIKKSSLVWSVCCPARSRSESSVDGRCSDRMFDHRMCWCKMMLRERKRQEKMLLCGMSFYFLPLEIPHVFIFRLVRGLSGYGLTRGGKKCFYLNQLLAPPTHAICVEKLQVFRSVPGVTSKSCQLNLCM